MISVALLSFQAYGVAWDEGSQRFIGEVTWKYIFEGDNFLLTYPDGDHGAGFEIPLIVIEKIFRLKDLHQISLMRHLVTHLFFGIGALFCYRLTLLLYHNKLLAVLAFLLFVLHPHIYSHSFFNSKDLPFLSLFMICFYLSARLFQTKNLWNTFILGVCLGLLINIRMMGLLLLACVLFFLAVDALREKKYFLNLKFAFFLILTAVFALYATWPFLWKSPITNFLKALKSMSHFNWAETNLYDGKNVSANKLGWEYIPVWFSVTTPLPYLLAGLFGIVMFIRTFIKQPLLLFAEVKGKLNLIFLICFFVPIVAVIALHSVVYDGWRHLFFIYPSFCMLLIFGFSKLIIKYQKAVVIGSALSFVFVLTFMISNFPFGHVYFNQIVSLHTEPEFIRKHYNMDYWGTSYKQSLEYILEHDSSPVITVFPENYPGILNAGFLPANQRNRIMIVPNIEQATYFITNYRWHENDYPFEDKKVYDIRVLNSCINSVYKLK